MSVTDEALLRDVMGNAETHEVDLRFTDLAGTWHHITLDESQIREDFFKNGTMIDGSSIPGWMDINDSELALFPDMNTVVVEDLDYNPAVSVICDVRHPVSLHGYEKDPRATAQRAESFLKTVMPETVGNFGPELEFFLFDKVRSNLDPANVGFKVEYSERPDTTNRDWGDSYSLTKGRGYMPAPPNDTGANFRRNILESMREVGLQPEKHHHEVAPGQHEIGMRYDSLLKSADNVQTLKYIIKQHAYNTGRAATFMPKPVYNDNGSGMHVHQSISGSGEDNLYGNNFDGDRYGGLSDTGLYYIGGILRHAKALCAFTNATTNSYKRLVPGFEAPVHLAYSTGNRSAAIRIPYTSDTFSRRIEVRFPDSSGNPYLSFAAMLMAGLDGIVNKIDPGDPMEKNLYDLPPEELQNIDTLPTSLNEALDHLVEDNHFLTIGGVFMPELIESYIKLKREEYLHVNRVTHPAEYDLYFSC